MHLNNEKLQEYLGDMEVVEKTVTSTSAKIYECGLHAFIESSGGGR
jgi:hypothetical protein